MNNFFSYLRLLLLATSGMLLLCIIFTMNPELADGTLSGKVCWFHFTSLLLAGGVLLMEFTTKKSRFIFSLPDALLLLLFGIVLVSYDKDENLQPERFLFIAQLVALWFMLRGALQAHQELRPFFITIIIFTGIVPAIWGISHTIDPTPITHPVFKLLEISLKPEPFYGYIAVIFPICLNTLLRFKNCDKIALWESRTFLFLFLYPRSGVDYYRLAIQNQPARMDCRHPFRDLGLLDEDDRVETDERNHTAAYQTVCHLFNYPVCNRRSNHPGRKYPKSPGRRPPTFDLEYHDPGYHGTPDNWHRYRWFSCHIRKGAICLFRNRYRLFKGKANRNLSPICV